MPNTAKYLKNDTHLMGLLRTYISRLKKDGSPQKPLLTVEVMESAVSREQEINPGDYFNESDYEALENPDHTISAYKMDVIAKGSGGSQNIANGYWRAVVQCLKNNQNPSNIRVISIINHDSKHWTSSVADCTLAPDYLSSLRFIFGEHELEQLQPFEIINRINEQYPEHNINEGSFVFGAQAIHINHYDSHNPNPSQNTGSYYKAYEPTLNELFEVNPDVDVRVKAKPCLKQKSNTCGDNSMWNGFIAGVLGLDPADPKFQLDSNALRAFTEHNLQFADLPPQAKDKALAESFDKALESNINYAKQKAQNPSVEPIKNIEPPSVPPHQSVKPKNEPEKPSVQPPPRTGKPLFDVFLQSISIQNSYQSTRTHKNWSVISLFRHASRKGEIDNLQKMIAALASSPMEEKTKKRILQGALLGYEEKLKSHPQSRLLKSIRKLTKTPELQYDVKTDNEKMICIDEFNAFLRNQPEAFDKRYDKELRAIQQASLYHKNILRSEEPSIKKKKGPGHTK